MCSPWRPLADLRHSLNALCIAFLVSREREGLLARRRAEIEQERIRTEQKRVAEAAVNLQPHPAEAQQGFIPFYSEFSTAEHSVLMYYTVC